MTNPNTAQRVEEDARLTILRELNGWGDGRLNELLCGTALEAAGHFRSRDWIRTQLRKMAELGAIDLDDIGGEVFVAKITRAGVDHVARRSRIEGIAQTPLGA